MADLLFSSSDHWWQMQRISASYLLALALSATALITAAAALLRRLRRRRIYLIDYSCFRPPDSWRVSYANFLEHSALNGMPDGHREFQKKIIQHSGLSEMTSLPPAYHYLPCRKAMSYSRHEAQTVFFAMLDELLSKSGVKPQHIDVLVLNCCLFYPSPSLSAMLVNRYSMREDVKTFNISGMGCAASLLAIDLAKQLMSARPNTVALVVSSENMSGRDYFGARKSMLIANCLFRSGGAAVLLSNRPAHRRRAKYRLLHTVRTHTAADDQAFSCITHGEDDDGHIGVSLSKDLMSVAAKALTLNMTAMAPLVLPISEMLRYAANYTGRKYLAMEWKPYTPDFKKAFGHFCIHAGGKAVIQEIEKSLGLAEEEGWTEASKMTLHRFGNTSSTSVWYEMAYEEAMQKVKKGDKVWQVGLGSGFKCFSAVWVSLRDERCSLTNPWRDCLLSYPLHIPDSADI